MTKTKAIERYLYWSQRSAQDPKSEEMTQAWIWAYDTGEYRKLPNNYIKADELVVKLYRSAGK